MGEIIIFLGVLTKFNFLMKFPHLEKIVNLMKYLKYEHQSIFDLRGRSKLILGTGMETKYLFLELQLLSSFFTGLSKNDFGIILQTLTHP